MMQRWKRMISSLLCAVMLLGNFPVVSSAAETDGQNEVCAEEAAIAVSLAVEEAVATAVDGAESAQEENEGAEEIVPCWTIFNGVLTVFYLGDPLSTPCDWRGWEVFRDEIQRVVISDAYPASTSMDFSNYPNLSSAYIGSGSVRMQMCPNLTSVEFGPGVTALPAHAFHGCESLTTVSLPKYITSIGYNAFMSCISLSSIQIPEGVTQIESGTFSGCSALTQINLPDSITQIGESAFYECSSLTQIDLPDHLSQIGDGAFRFTGLTQIEIPGSVTTIGESAFAECSDLSEVKIHDGVTQIGEYAFDLCSALTQIELPDSITQIGGFAFRGCSSLTEIELPDDITQINQSTFAGCSELMRINLPKKLTAIGYDAFGHCSNIKEFNLPEGLMTIGEYAFAGCSGWTAVHIPSSVMEIGESAFSASWAINFNRTYTVSPANTSFCVDQSGVLYNMQKTRLLAAPEGLSGRYVTPSSLTTIDPCAFMGCGKMTEVVLPDRVSVIGDDAFNLCTGLTSFDIPKSLRVIPASCFEFCKLKEMVIPDGIKEIYSHAFAEVTGLDCVIFLGNAPAVVMQWSDSTDPVFRANTNTVFYYPGEDATWTDSAKLALGGAGSKWVPIKEAGIELEIFETEIYSEAMVCGTVIFSNGETTMEPVIRGYSDAPYSDVEMVFTLPEGFSFSETELKQQMTYTDEWFDQEDTIPVDPIYPIYIDPSNQKEKYAISVKITAKDLEGNIVMRMQELVFYFPISSDNIAKPICVKQQNLKDYPFDLSSATGSGATYNQETARLCAIMSDTAYDRIGMEEFLTKRLGFSDYERQGVGLDPTVEVHKMGRYYASKTIIRDGKIQNIVYVVCRGTTTPTKIPFLGLEWVSNLLVGTKKDTHMGFQAAAEDVQQELTAYCKKHEFAPANTIIVVTGHSRGAAVANLVGHWLNTESKLAQKENISVYTFATPAVDRRIVSEADGYQGHENIFNFVYYQDVIRNAPSMQYYGRYGSTTIYGFSPSAIVAGKHDAGYGSYTIVAGYTITEFWNAMLYRYDHSIGTENLKLLGDLKILNDQLGVHIPNPIRTGFSEELFAHEQTYYSAVVNNAQGGNVAEMNARAEEIYAYYKSGLFERVDAIPVYLEQIFCCPINIIVYDTEGREVARVVDKQVTCDDENMFVYVDGDAIHIGMLESDFDAYTIRVEGYDDGTMKHSIVTVGSGNIESLQHREDIPIEKGGILEVNNEGYIVLHGESEEEAEASYDVYTEEEDMEEFLVHNHDYSQQIRTEPTYTEKGFTTFYCTCGDSYVDSYVDPLPLPEAEVAVARMILGNELAMQFAFLKENIVEGVEYVVSVTKTYADGREDKNILVPMDQWGTSGSYYYVSFNGIAAKEMGDEIHAQILTMDGTPVGDVYTDSVQAYAVRQLRKATEAEIRTLYVDMLNYGAAAQTYFKYDAANLVTKGLTETEKSYGTQSVKLENNLVKGDGYVASQLDLGSSILLRVKFNGIDSSMHAVVSFTSHTGTQKNVTIPGSEFISGSTVVVIDQVVAADYNQDVTITVYDADGKAVANAVESVASYLARQLEKPNPLAIYDAVAKYCAAAYGYLHK